MLTGVPVNDVSRWMDELMKASLPPIEIPLVMKLEDAYLIFCSFMVQATFQNAVSVSDLVTLIATYRYISNP